MSINRDKFGALLFLCLALIYGFYHSLSRLPDLDHDLFGRGLRRSWRTPDQGFAGCIHPCCFHFLVPADPTDGHLSGTG